MVSKYLNESLQEQINEDKISSNAYKRISKFLDKSNLSFNKNGFEPFGSDGKTLFGMFYTKVVDSVFDEINFSEYKRINKGFAKSIIGEVTDEKVKRFIKHMFKDSRINTVSESIARIVKWDVVTFTSAMNLYFEEQGFRELILKTEDI